MAVRGQIYFKKNFHFPTGSPSDKLLVLLNTAKENEPHLFVLTTSKQKHRKATPGCIEAQNTYFIQADTDFFDSDTWILLDRRFEIDLEKSTGFESIGILKESTIRGIIKCLLEAQSEDLTREEEELIKKGIKGTTTNSSLERLKDKFDKSRL